MNILFLTPRLPYPLIGGDRIKPYHLLSHLAKHHNVTLVSFYQGKQDWRAYQKELEKLGLEVFIIPLNPIKAGLSCLFRIYQLKPLEILYYLQSEFRKKVNELLSERKYDIAFAFFMRTAEYLKKASIPKVLIAEDCREIYQYRSFRESKSIPQKAIRLFEYLTLKYYEPRTMKCFDRNTFVSEEDINFMYQAQPLDKYRLITNGTEIDRFIPDDFSKRHTILFTGNLGLWANKMMMDRIIDRIFPAIKKEIPEATLTFVGARAPEYIKELHRNGFLTLYENVPDFVPYLQQARLFLHPHLGASGIQNKLLEAMSAGCPVVTTPSGNQGIHGVHNVHLMIGVEDDEIIEHSLDLLRNEEKARTISQNARQLIVTKHSWNRVFQDLDNLIAEVLNGK